MKKSTIITISGEMAEQITYFKEREVLEGYKTDLAAAFAHISWHMADESNIEELKKWQGVMHILTLFNDYIDLFHSEANR